MTASWSYVVVPGQLAAASMLPAGRRARASSSGVANAASRERVAGSVRLCRRVRPCDRTSDHVQVFDEEGALDRFEAFASLNGAHFYGLPVKGNGRDQAQARNRAVGRSS